MIQRDYLMRQLMQLLEVLQRIILYRKNGNKEQAGNEVRTFFRFMKIEEDLRELSIEDLTHKLFNGKSYTNEQIELIAFVLKEQGEMEESEDLRKSLFMKSLFLLERIDRESIVYSMERQIKLGELREYLRGN